MHDRLDTDHRLHARSNLSFVYPLLEVARNPLNTVFMSKRMLASHVKTGALIQEACSAGHDDNRSLALFTTSAL